MVVPVAVSKRSADLKGLVLDVWCFMKSSMDNMKVMRVGTLSWVIVGGSMHRCSVHSVRKVNERERLEYELHNPEDPAQWQSLADMIPNRSYIDVTNEEPDENEEEGPHLPLQPDADTMKMPEYVPKTRHTTKSGPKWHQVFTTTC